jgi:hypothetical protein
VGVRVLLARSFLAALLSANTDAGANAYTGVAIDHAWRAVHEMKA